MKRILLLLLFFGAVFAPCKLLAQKKVNVDSLVNVLNKYPKEDTVRVKMLKDIAFYYKGNTDKAIEYAEKCVALAEQLNLSFFKATAYYTLGCAIESKGVFTEALTWLNKALPIYENLGKIVNVAEVYAHFGAIANAKHEGQNAQQYYQKAISLLEKTKEKELVLFCMSGLATTYLSLGEYQKAIVEYDNSIKLYEASHDKEGVARVLGNKSGAYYYLAEYAKGIDCLQKALAINEQMGNQRATLFNYNGLAGIYMELNEYQKARDIAKKGLEVNQSIKNKRLEAALTSLLGSASFRLGELDDAIIYFEKSNEILKQANNQVEFTRNLTELSRIYIEKGQYSKAYQNDLNILKTFEQLGKSEYIGEAQRALGELLLSMPDSALLNVSFQPKDRLATSMDYLNKAVDTFRKLGLKFSESNALKYISKNFEEQGDYVKAYETYKQYITIKDSISGDDVKKQITRKEIQYEFDKKEAELKFQQQLTAGELEKQKLLTFQQEQALTLNRQTLTLKEQALALSNKEKDLAHLAFLKEQAEKQEKAQELSLAEEREKGNELALKLKNSELFTKNSELSAKQKENSYLAAFAALQQKQKLYLAAFAALLLLGLGVLWYFYGVLRKQKNVIAQQNELNEHTISILSHDIKSPLLGVKLLLKKLNKDDPFVAQASQSLEHQINAVNGILNNLLKMRKIALNPKDKNAMANVKEAVENVLHELKVAIQTKNLTIQNDLQDNVTLPIAPEKLQIILHNLLSNAIKYSFSDKTIHLYSEGKGICIQDAGVGLSPEQRSKLMREVTTSQQGTNQERGNGLGLFLVGAMLQGEAIKVMFESPAIGGTLARIGYE